MVLCAVSKDHSVVRLLEVPEGTKVGERVTFPGFPADSVPATPAQMVKKKILEELAPGVSLEVMLLFFRTAVPVGGTFLLMLLFLYSFERTRLASLTGATAPSPSVRISLKVQLEPCLDQCCRFCSGGGVCSAPGVADAVVS